jgi:hypothetical protein
MGAATLSRFLKACREGPVWTAHSPNRERPVAEARLVDGCWRVRLRTPPSAC